MSARPLELALEGSFEQLSAAVPAKVGVAIARPDRTFSLGGPRTLAGYQYDEVRVNSYWYADANFLWRLKEVSSIKRQAIYGGFGMYVSGLYDRLDQVPDDVVYGAGAYLAGSTPIGTLNFGVAFAEHNSSMWLSIGRSVGKGSMLDDGLFK